MSSVLNPYQAPAAALADAVDATDPVRVFGVSGRIGRVRYFAYSGALYLVASVAAVLLTLVHPVLGLLAYAAMLTHIFMLTIQRCHDFDMSGWLSPLVLVPLANLIFVFMPGTEGVNRYGGPTPPNSVGVLVLAWLFPIVGAIGIVAAIAVPHFAR